jgi:hypothetical protein
MLVGIYKYELNEKSWLFPKCKRIIILLSLLLSEINWIGFIISVIVAGHLKQEWCVNVDMAQVSC